MTSLLASPDTPNPDLTATIMLPRETAPPPAPESASPPSLSAPNSLFYARADDSPPPTATPPAPEPSVLPPDPPLPALAAPSSEPSLLSPGSTDSPGSADSLDSPGSPGSPGSPHATAAPSSEPSLLSPDSLFYAAASPGPQPDSAPSPAPEPSLLAPTSLYYAPPDHTPPPNTSAEPLLAPTSLFYAATHRAPIAPTEPSVSSSQHEPPPIPEPSASPLGGSPPHGRVPEPVLVTSEPHDPTAADRRARLVLHHASEPGDALLCRLVARFGAPTVASAILSGSAADLLSSHDEESAADRAALISRANTLQTRCYRADPDADLAVGAKTGARYVIPADDEWPTALNDLGDTAPLGMWFLGSADLVAASKRGVSIVGARIATGYGMHVAGELAAGLAERGWAVISGAARGIDGAAHRGALAARGVTVAALACGIDLVYPAGHEALIGAIASDGLVLSELPPGTSVSRFRFLDRNRVIAALGLGTVVVEAAARSGSLVTARLADGIGRPVLALPGPVTSEASEGTHQLIRDGALLVTRATEVIEHLGDLGADLADPSTNARTSSRRPRDSLDPIAARVLDALPIAGRGTLDTVEAALAAGLEPRAVHAALGRLAAAGWVDRDEKGWCARLIP